LKDSAGENNFKIDLRLPENKQSRYWRVRGVHPSPIFNIMYALAVFSSGIVSAYHRAGLPEVSRYNIPKREKFTKITTKYSKLQ
jgi:hypothetical protein